MSQTLHLDLIPDAEIFLPGPALQAAGQLKSGAGQLKSGAGQLKLGVKVRGQKIMSKESIIIPILIRLKNRWIQMDPFP